MIIFENAGWLSPPVQGRDMCVLEGEHWMGNRTLPLCFDHFKDGGEAGIFGFTEDICL